MRDDEGRRHFRITRDGGGGSGGTRENYPSSRPDPAGSLHSPRMFGPSPESASGRTAACNWRARPVSMSAISFGWLKIIVPSRGETSGRLRETRKNPDVIASSSVFREKALKASGTAKISIALVGDLARRLRRNTCVAGGTRFSLSVRSRKDKNLQPFFAGVIRASTELREILYRKRMHRRGELHPRWFLRLSLGKRVILVCPERIR